MTSTFGAEKRDVTDGSVVYFLSDGERIAPETWQVKKGVIVDKAEETGGHPLVSVQDGFEDEPDVSSFFAREVKIHPNELFTAREIIDTISADESRADHGIGFHEGSDQEIDGVLSFEVGNYLVARALMHALDQRAEQEVSARLAG
jgi:hypothetical protein